MDDAVQYALAPWSLRGRQFGTAVNRGTTTLYFYAKTSGTVTFYEDASGTGINGTPTDTISVTGGSVTSYSVGVPNYVAGVSYHYWTSDVDIITTATSSNDRFIVPPMADAGEEVYRRRNGFERAADGNGPSSQGTYRTRDDNDPHFNIEIADGAGGDATHGLPEKFISNHYTWGSTLSDFALVIPNTGYVRISSWNGSSWTEHEVFSGYGDTTNPSYFFRDGNAGFGVAGTNISGSSTVANFNSNTLWKWEGSDVFYIVINDAPDDEESLLGWMADL